MITAHRPCNESSACTHDDARNCADGRLLTCTLTSPSANRETLISPSCTLSSVAMLLASSTLACPVNRIMSSPSVKTMEEVTPSAPATSSTKPAPACAEPLPDLEATVRTNAVRSPALAGPHPPLNKRVQFCCAIRTGRSALGRPPASAAAVRTPRKAVAAALLQRVILLCTIVDCG